MKTISRLYSEKSLLVLLMVFITFLFQACNPNEDTGENLVAGDIADDGFDEIDIYVINENTLYGLRDNNRPSDNGNGKIEPFLISQIPGYATSSSPTLNDPGKSSRYGEGNYTNTSLLVASTNGILYNYDIPGGTILWQTELGGTSSATPSNFLISESEGFGICVGTNNGQLHFINNSTGEILSTYTNPSGLGFDSKIWSNYFVDRVIAGSGDGHVYYFRGNGDLITDYDTGDLILAGPIIARQSGPELEDEVIVGNRNGSLLKLSMDGELIWNTQLSGAIYATPSIKYSNVIQKKILVTTTNGLVYQIDASTGNVDWEFQAEGLVYSSAEISPYSNSLYFTSTDGNVYALNESGILQWKTDLGDGALYATPNLATIREDQLYVNTINGVYGLNANTGEIFSNFTVTHSPNADVSGNFKSSPAVFAFFK